MLHVSTNHEMVPASTQGPPPHHYGHPHPHSAGPPSGNPYWGQPPPDWYAGQQPKRKPVRATQACDSCRQRKAKCDEGRPDCSHCKENGLKCVYRDVPPQKSDKHMLQITDKLEEFKDAVAGDIKTQHDKIDAQNARIDRLLEFFEKQTRAMASFDQVHGTSMARTRSRPQTKEEPYTGSSVNDPFMQSYNATQKETGMEIEPAPVVEPKTRGPMGASDLLMWPPIRDLVPRNIPVSYVMDGEMERGLLRLYGCGEGEDNADGHNPTPSPIDSSLSHGLDDDPTDSSPSGVWGTGQLPQRDPTHQPAYDHAGGVSPQGDLLLDRHVVDACVRSYLERMHILHPFLETKVLKKMVSNFKRRYSCNYDLPPRVQGIKRKRETSDSPSSVKDEMSRSFSAHTPMPASPRHASTIEHSISNAIILLVIALGKICAHGEALPGPVKSSSVHTVKSPQPFYGYGDLPPSASAPNSPFTAPYTNGNPPPALSKLQGKNMDVIPGLAYFAKAADILGELPGGIDVSHIQANLLAGLYMGQLARILPSHWYISNACKACQILIQSADYKADPKEGRMSERRRNLINFAFWSCLQLESDILAEMDIPASGIIHKEASMLRAIPDDLTVRDPDEVVENPRNDPLQIMRHYSNQIQLRRTINDAVHNLYSGKNAEGRPTRIIQMCDNNLEAWREILHDWNWDDDDHESSDINHARMRGKYYGARYIINRPALHYALSMAYTQAPTSHRLTDSPLGTGPPEATPEHGRVNHQVDGKTRGAPRSSEQVEEWMLQCCKVCVEAAIRSTTAFDKVPPRLVITNILGTAHAQFGNVLVLAATFTSPDPRLKMLVDEETLRRLLSRTITFLHDKGAISPALAKDAEILRHVQRKLFPSNSVYSVRSANSSFASH